MSVDIRIAPPAPRYEIIPVPRPGYAWAPGYWDYRHNHYYWVAGSWVARAAGLLLQQPDLGSAGRPLGPDPGQLGTRRSADRNAAWRDRDHDGIPNRYDRDRDDDGVPNDRDRRPDNPHRH